MALSETDLDSILAVMYVSWAQGTQETYGAGLLVFHIFCDTCDIPESQCCPAAPFLVIMYISSCASSYSGSTLTNYVFGLQAWHILHGQPWAMDDIQIKTALDGAAKLAPPASKCPKWEPFTLTLIEKLFSQLDHADPLDASVRACLTVSFFTLACTGEFTIPSLDSFDPVTHIKRSDVRATVDHHDNHVIVFRLPHTKSSRDGEDIYCAAQLGSICPISELGNHLSVNNPADSSHLFAYSHSGALCPLIKCAFLHQLNSIASVLGVESLKGHGIRIGGTLEYLLRGVPFDVMKSMGRWSSEAFTIYLCKHAVIMAPYLQGSPVLGAFTQYTMPPVHCH